MAADEYFDAIGNVISYVLSAEDLVFGQQRVDNGIKFVIIRESTNLELYARPNKRYFTLRYRFSLLDEIVAAYDDDNQLLSRHMEEFGIDDSAYKDERLYEIVAQNRVMKVDADEAKKTITDIRALLTHSDCRIQRLTRKNLVEDSEDDQNLWDGVEVIGLLYPYEDDFTPRDYEQVAQEVISVGNQVDESMAKLDVIQEIGTDNL